MSYYHDMSLFKRELSQSLMTWVTQTIMVKMMGHDLVVNPQCFQSMLFKLWTRYANQNSRLRTAFCSVWQRIWLHCAGVFTG